MKPVLQFLKTYSISLICAVVAVGAIVFGAMAWSSGEVVTEMKQELTRVGATGIPGLRGAAKNAEVIAAEKQRGELFKKEYDATVAEATRINRRNVLMDGVFPQPARIETPFRFKETYKKKMEVLYADLDADTLPTEAEIKEEELNVADLIELEREKRIEAEGDDASRSTGRVAPPGPGGRIDQQPVIGTGRGSSGNVDLPPEERGKPKYDPVYRARVAKAKSILCYYDKDTTFHVSPLADAVGAPSAAEMWAAQVELWIQEDIVKAIAELNQAAADAVVDTDPCVENTPVKRIVSIRVRGYQTEAAEKGGERDAFDVTQFTAASAAGAAATGGMGDAAPTLTGRKCNEQYDVVRFTVVLVIDQTKMQQVIDALTRANFYQCISAGYEAVDPIEAKAQGYFYGTAPVVYATLEFEGYMFREIYQELMPDDIKKALGITVEEG